MAAADGEIVLYGLVRDRDGHPIFDDIHNIPEPIWRMLTTAEQDQIRRERNTSDRG